MSIYRVNKNALKYLANCNNKTVVISGLNPLPDDKILDWSKFKALADAKTKLAQMIFLSLMELKTL